MTLQPSLSGILPLESFPLQENKKQIICGKIKLLKGPGHKYVYVEHLDVDHIKTAKYGTKILYSVHTLLSCNKNKI